MTLRVAHIISGLGIGGAERNLVNLLNAMSCEYRAVVCVGRPPAGPTFRGQLDREIEQFHIRIRHRSWPLGVLRLASVLRRKHIDVVHTHMYASNLFGTVAARLGGVPVVVTSEHGENPWKGPIQRWLERRVISPLADARFCVSPGILERRRDVDRVPASKLRLMVNGTAMPPLSRREPRDSGPVIGAVGRFIPAKDYPGLLHAVAQLRARGYRFRVVIVGGGPEAERIKQTVSELSLEADVELPGMVTDVDSWYRRFDVFVSSSVREGLPMVLLEAMAHGLPVVATDVGACSEVVGDREGGLIVPAGEPAALVDALGRLLDDARLRETLGRNARNRVERRYSVAAVADEHLRVYRELLSVIGSKR